MSDDDIARYVLETQRDGVVVVDPGWRVRYVNRCYERHTGLSAADAIGRNLWALLPAAAEPSSPYFRNLHRAMQEGIEVSFESFYPPFNAWTSTTAYPAPDGGLIILYRDITAQRRTELAHAEARDYLRRLVESLAEGVFGLDPRGRCTFINPAALRLLGYRDASKVVGKQMHRLVHHSYADGSRYPTRDCPSYRALRDGRSCRDVLTTFWRADGSPLLVRESTEPLIRDGASVGAVTTFTDVGGQIRREEQARWLEEAGHLLAAEVTDYDQLLNRLGELVVPRIADWFAIDLVEPGGGTRLAAIRHQDPAKVALARAYRERYPPKPGGVQGVYAVIESGEPRFAANMSDDTLERLARDPEHLRMLHMLGVKSSAVLPLVARGRVIGALTLISSQSDKLSTTEDFSFAKELAARAALAIDNARLYDEVKRSVAVRDDVLAVVSHDLKSPLTAINLTAATLLRRTKGKTPRRLLQNILQATERMEGLIKDLLDMAQIRAGRFSISPEPVAVKTLLQESVDVGRPQALAKGLEISADLALDETVTITGSRVRLSQAIDNLIGNAVKFCRPGGRIAVRGEASDSAVSIDIEDNGPGIAPELLPRLFTAYWSASEHRNIGTGLGLYICKGIIEAHGGRIDVRSELGHGTTFSIRLPRRRARKRAAGIEP